MYSLVEVVVKGSEVKILEVIVEELEIEILEKIKKAKAKDKEIVRVIEKMKKVGIKTLKRDEWEIDNEVVLKEGKIMFWKIRLLSGTVHTGSESLWDSLRDM